MVNYLLSKPSVLCIQINIVTIVVQNNVVSNPGTGRCIVARMTNSNGGPLSLGSIPSGRLKILRVIYK